MLMPVHALGCESCHMFLIPLNCFWDLLLLHVSANQVKPHQSVPSEETEKIAVTCLNQCACLHFVVEFGVYIDSVTIDSLYMIWGTISFASYKLRL